MSSERTQNPFDGCSEEYQRFRPGYPSELYDRLTRYRPSLALDVGAGTGKGAEPLSQRGISIICAELSHNMALEGRRYNPALQYVGSRAETLPFPNSTFDLITAAQCFHWFDPAATLPELERVLKADGEIAIFWNSRDLSLPHTQAFEDVIKVFNPEHKCGYREKDWGAVIESTGHLRVSDFQEFGFVQRMTVDDWIGLARSVSYVRKIGDAKMPAFESALREELRRFDRVDLNYITDCWFAKPTRK